MNRKFSYLPPSIPLRHPYPTSIRFFFESHFLAENPKIFLDEIHNILSYDVVAVGRKYFNWCFFANGRGFH